jgi:hypothetical protein
MIWLARLGDESPWRIFCSRSTSVSIGQLGVTDNTSGEIRTPLDRTDICTLGKSFIS